MNTPTLSKIPHQPGPSTATPKRPSSSSSSVSSTSRRRTPSPPTSRPTSSSRHSPPHASLVRTNSSPSSLPNRRGDRSPPLTKKDEKNDTAKMPPPPPRPRRTAKPEEKRRTGSVSGKQPKAEDEKPSAASRSLGKLLSLKPSTSRLAAKGTPEPEPSKKGSVRSRAATVDRASEKTDLGRTMSLRSRIAGNGGKAESTSTARARAGTATTKQRPVSMYGATNTSKQDLSSTATSVKRPSTSSNSTTSMPPPPAPPVKGHRKSASSVTAASVQNAIAAQTTTTTTNANSRPTTAGSTKPKRPAFSAMNQDFSTPINPTLPPSPRSRVLPPPPLDTPTIHAQTQLLQLLTLHSSSAAVYQQLITSATATLKSRFEKLSARHYDARETALKKQKRHNLDSLAAVVNNVVPGKKRRDTTKSPEERVQAFSEAIKRIDAMRSGEFRKLCGVFGEWIAGYNPRGTSRDKWVDGIGDVWRRECVGISRRLEVSIAGVDGVAGVLAEHGEEEAVVTTVTRVAEGYKELAEGMLEEVEMMRRMEVEVVERERMELRRRADVILEVASEGAYRRTAIWAAG